VVRYLLLVVTYTVVYVDLIISDAQAESSVHSRVVARILLRTGKHNLLVPTAFSPHLALTIHSTLEADSL
jgi:hypothetical protein